MSARGRCANFPAKGVLTPACGPAAEKHLLLVAWDAAAAAAGKEPGIPELAPLMKAQLAVLTVDLNGQEAKGELHLTFSTEAEATAEERRLRQRDKVVEPIQWLKESATRRSRPR